MKFEKILKQAGLRIIASGGGGNPDIGDITCDSRAVGKGGLFVAIPGKKENGETFIADAIRSGAAAVVSGNRHENISVPWAQVENPRSALGLLGKSLWAADIGAVQFIGITGTNGKTTTAHLFSRLFEQRFGRKRTWMFGTIDYNLGDVRRSASHTTPEAAEVFRSIGNTGEDRRPRAVIMEVSSHALSLDRVGGITFDAAVFTNLTQDHLDFHHTMEDYYRAKKRLFTDFLHSAGCSVINIDDPYGSRLAGETVSGRRVTFGKSENADARIVKEECNWDGTYVELCVHGDTIRVHSPLRGFFNVYNLAALCACATALSFSRSEIELACGSVGTVTGRMEKVALDAPYSVVVDYAHSPDALVNVLRTCRSLTKGRLICVFGCGGDRDRTKRPLMGEAVAGFCDEAVVTSDNPRSEPPEAIIEEIRTGIPLDFPYSVVADRREAIRKALSIARRDDCVVVAGKGHETYQDINGVKHPFDDKQVIAAVYKELEAHASVN